MIHFSVKMNASTPAEGYPRTQSFEDDSSDSDSRRSKKELNPQTSTPAQLETLQLLHWK